MTDHRSTIDGEQIKRCCGTCKHLSWYGGYGECMGGWLRNIYGEHVRPEIWCKGMGYGCRTWEPKQAAVIEKGV